MKTLYRKPGHLFGLIGLIVLSTLSLSAHLAAKDSQSFARRDLSIIASDSGFFPSQLSVFVGEEVHFYLTATSELPSCFILDDTSLFLEAKKGEVQHGVHRFKRAGVHRFYCPKGAISGQLTVLEDPRVVRQQKRKRELASENEAKARPSLWLPRE